MRASIDALERALAATEAVIAIDRDTIALNEASTARLRQDIAAGTAKAAELQKAIEMLKGHD